ncbi:MAG: A/G-specific adenine glycosylase [Lysobacterales bacterium CG17_big_fil_post_rev_8_21_14_2_50_64_11]|nr:MAG: A/G-specific adenine glycosylase [Xanthomonadales bacterium CG17_big_fil_post_rev_8_21_14_2_50_64_11]PIX61137.1 MAG: A/G-specific adenine glycosylase [Xanthomonadales bacterium CG_4_10_14_3_um_filter_64_11]
MTTFAAQLLAWFDHAGRHDLPWQHPRSPYRVWLAEVMLQQTQVRTVIPYFQRFTTALPTLPALARAPLDEVLALWSGLGYYSRARNLHRAASLCMQRHGGELPHDFTQLIDLPGIGRSTAGAILAQAHGLPFAILDGNVRRVLCRVHGVDGWPGASATQQQLWSLAQSHLPTARLADYTQAQMDLGASVCTRSNPRCGDCPLRTRCAAHRQQRTAELPTRRSKPALPQREACMLLVLDEQRRLLLLRRPPTGIWGSLWSLPQLASRAEGEQWLAGIAQSCTPPQPLGEPLLHTFSHFRLLIAPLHCVMMQAKPIAGDNPDLQWRSLDSLCQIGLPAPVRRLISRLAA